MNMYVVTPIAGAVIGYFTNWLAIKMLFRPYNEVKIANVKLPFTPGLIPSERYVISKNIGNTISTHLLTEKVIHDYINKNIDLSKLLEELEPEIKKLKEQNLTVDSLLELIFKENKNILIFEFQNNLTTYVNTFLNSALFDSYLEQSINIIIDSISIKEIDLNKILSSNTELNNILINFVKNEITKNSINGILCSLQNSQAKLDDYVDSSSLNSIINKLTFFGRDHLLNLLKNNDYTNEKLKEIVFKIVDANVSGLAAMFVNKENIYEQIHSSIITYIETEENVEVLSNYFCNCYQNILANTFEENLNKFSDETINNVTSFIHCIMNNEDFIKKIIFEFTINLQKTKPMQLNELLTKVDVDYKLKVNTFLAKKIKNLLETKKEIHFSILTKLLLSIKINTFINILEKNKNFLIEKSSYLINLAIPYAIKKINVSEITEEQMNKFDISELESLIQSIAKKELRAITYVGALLGFIIGLIPAIIQILDKSF